VIFADRNRVERQNEIKYLAEYKSQLEIARYDKVPSAQIAHIFLLAQWNCRERGV